MTLFSKIPAYIGIELFSSSMRIIALEKKKKKWQILFFKELPIKEGAALLAPFVSKSCITTVISQRQVLIRTLHFDLKKESDARKAIEFQIEAHLPFSIEEAIIQSALEKKEPTGFSATVFALKGDALKKHLEKQREAHIEPDAITTHSLALSSLLSLTIPPKGMVQFLINIGEEETTVALVKGAKIIDQRSFLTEKQGMIEMQKAILSLENQYPKESSKAVLLFGKGSHKLVTSLQEATGKNIHTLSLPIDQLSSDEIVTYAIALGAAVSQAENAPLNFRQKKYATPYPHKFIKKPLLFSLALTVLSVGLLWTGGQCHLNQRKNFLQNQITSLLTFQKNEEFPSLKNLEDCTYALRTLEEKIASKEPRYALEARLPQLSEILHWLSEEVCHAPPPLKGLLIDSIDYKLITRPTPLVNRERYKVQIELSFIADSPNVKESLQELLEQANSIVDPEETIEVSFFENRGKALFILRDNTRYE